MRVHALQPGCEKRQLYDWSDGSRQYNDLPVLESDLPRENLQKVDSCPSEMEVLGWDIVHNIFRYKFTTQKNYF